MPPARIAGFLKVRNGFLRDGELPRAVTHLESLCDEVFVCDDGSYDGSYEWLKARLGWEHVVRSRDGESGFKWELHGKERLIERVHDAGPWDFVLWLDSDESLDKVGAAALREFADAALSRFESGYAPADYPQLWGSLNWRRTDGAFGSTPARARLWRWTPDLHFAVPQRGQAHLDDQVPRAVRLGEIGTMPGALLHYGWVGQRRRLRLLECAGMHGPRATLLADPQLAPFDPDNVPNELRLQPIVACAAVVEARTYALASGGLPMRARCTVIDFVSDNLDALDDALAEALGRSGELETSAIVALHEGRLSMSAAATRRRCGEDPRILYFDGNWGSPLAAVEVARRFAASVATETREVKA